MPDSTPPPEAVEHTRPPLAADDDTATTHEVARRLQEAVSQVYRSHSGLATADIEAALTQAIAAAGIPEQPAPWVRSTVTEIGAGRIVVVSQEALTPGDPATSANRESLAN